jgi:hypothetical protein
MSWKHFLLNNIANTHGCTTLLFYTNIIQQNMFLYIYCNTWFESFFNVYEINTHNTQYYKFHGSTKVIYKKWSLHENFCNNFIACIVFRLFTPCSLFLILTTISIFFFASFVLPIECKLSANSSTAER